MAIISIPNTFSAGAVIIASQHNSNFSTIYTDYNGNIDNTNIVAAAGIVASKLDLTSPGAIGSTAANTGKFTTLQATGATTLSSTLNLGSTHQGDVLYDNGTSIVRLTPGTTGQFLQTQGTSANPQWATQAITFKFISKTSPAAATNSGDIAITNTNTYLVVINISLLGGSDSLSLRFNNDTTANKYGYINRGFDLAATAANANSNFGATSILMGPSMLDPSGNHATLSYTFYIFPQLIGSTANYITIQGRANGIFNSSSIMGYSDFSGAWNNSTTAATSFRIITTSGQNMTGDINLYQILQQ